MFFQKKLTFWLNSAILLLVMLMTIYDRIKYLRENANMSQQELAEKVGFKTASAVNKIELGLRDINQTKILAFAKALETTPSFLLGEDDISGPSNIDSVSERLYNVPVYETVSAGFGAAAVDSVIDYIPLPFKTKAEADETLCIRVKGDSMSPKIEDGDLIQVVKQTSVDSGDVAVVLIDGKEGLVKKVEYDTDYIKLISFNPYYPPIEFKGKDVLRVFVVGKVKKIIRDL